MGSRIHDQIVVHYDDAQLFGVVERQTYLESAEERNGFGQLRGLAVHCRRATCWNTHDTQTLRAIATPTAAVTHVVIASRDPPRATDTVVQLIVGEHIVDEKSSRHQRVQRQIVQAERSVAFIEYAPFNVNLATSIISTSSVVEGNTVAHRHVAAIVDGERSSL